MTSQSALAASRDVLSTSSPTMFGLEHSRDWHDTLPEIAASVTFLDRFSVELAR